MNGFLRGVLRDASARRPPARDPASVSASRAPLQIQRHGCERGAALRHETDDFGGGVIRAAQRGDAPLRLGEGTAASSPPDVCGSNSSG